MKYRCFINLLSFILLSFGSATAENWPSWRGPLGDGISTEKQLPVQWSRTQNIHWRLPLPGPAAATPVVWGDRIFLTSVDKDYLLLLCVSTDGKLLWRRTVGSGNDNVRGDEGNFAAPSPSTDGRNVYAFFGTGDLVCYDFDGKEVWRANLQERYGKFNLNFVMASTPLLDRNSLYVQLLHADASLVLALDKTTGREIWKYQRISDARNESEHSYASPFLYRDNQHEFLLIHGADYITAHRLSDGAEIWRCGGLNKTDHYNSSFRFIASPVASSGLIVVPSAKNGPVLGLRSDSKGDISNNKKQHVWVLSDGSPDVPSPLLQGGFLYLCRENGDLTCLDAKTGAKIYEQHTHRSRHRASPVYADGLIYITAREGIVTVVRAGKTFEILAQNDLEEPISASPAISNGTIYLRSYNALYAIRSSK